MGFVSFNDDRSGLIACDVCGRFLIEPNRISGRAWTETDPAELGAHFVLADDAVGAAIRAGWDCRAARREAPARSRWRCRGCLAAASHLSVAAR
jgi:hypothetical protein